MCGREPNFELSEEEKHELAKLKWEEFLAMTRHAITNKSNMFSVHLIWRYIATLFRRILCSYISEVFSEHKRRVGAGSEKKSEPEPENGDWDGEEANSLSGSEEVEPDASVSWKFDPKRGWTINFNGRARAGRH